MWGWSPTEFHNTSKASFECVLPDENRRSSGSNFITLSYILDLVIGFLINFEPLAEFLCSSFFAHKRDDWLPEIHKYYAIHG